MIYQECARLRAEALRRAGRATILAIESSCDETAAAVVEDGRTVRSGVIASQIDSHALYGGVVPEIASRMHVEALDHLAAEALSGRGYQWKKSTRWAVTYGPGSWARF
jgi:N6-L-threonylcarbamoyladenine synthase